jgi:hypothetical protein
MVADNRCADFLFTSNRIGKIGIPALESGRADPPDDAADNVKLY